LGLEQDQGPAEMRDGIVLIEHQEAPSLVEAGMGEGVTGLPAARLVPAVGVTLAALTFEWVLRDATGPLAGPSRSMRPGRPRDRRRSSSTEGASRSRQPF
jgi:hypothetical protein